jgi:ABC-type multidrug transport system ATPase subunit
MLVQITNLQKVYDNKIFALTGITANLKRGEIVALLG